MSCTCNCKREPVKVHFYSEKYENGVMSIQDMKFASPNAACVDIRCKEDFSVNPDDTKMIATGLFVSFTAI